MSRKPRKLYHQSRRSRRKAIAANGLDPAYGLRRRRGCGTRAVYLTSERDDCFPFTDVWEVDTRGIEVEQHFGEETWWLSQAVIPPSRIRLVQSEI